MAPYWKLQPVIRTVNMELRSLVGLCAETILTPGLEFLMDQKSFVMDSNNNDIQVPEDQPEEQALQLDAKDSS